MDTNHVQTFTGFMNLVPTACNILLDNDLDGGNISTSPNVIRANIDGQGHKLKNATFIAESVSNSGILLFERGSGYEQSILIENLTIDSVGIVAGSFSGTNSLLHSNTNSTAITFRHCNINVTVSEIFFNFCRYGTFRFEECNITLSPKYGSSFVYSNPLARGANLQGSSTFVKCNVIFNGLILQRMEYENVLLRDVNQQCAVVFYNCSFDVQGKNYGDKESYDYMVFNTAGGYVAFCGDDTVSIKTTYSFDGTESVPWSIRVAGSPNYCPMVSMGATSANGVLYSADIIQSEEELRGKSGTFWIDGVWDINPSTFLGLPFIASAGNPYDTPEPISGRLTMDGVQVNTLIIDGVTVNVADMDNVNFWGAINGSG